MSIDRIEQRASRALAHPDLAWLLDDLPNGYKNNPKAISALLVAAAAADPAFAESQPYRDAHAALVPAVAARTLRDQVSELYWSPEIRAKFGTARVAAAFRDPATAYRELIQQSAAGGLSPHLDKALNVIGEVRQFASEHGIAEPVPAEFRCRPMPARPRASLQRSAPNRSTAISPKLRMPG
jgi:hypothetical protein